MWGVVFRRFGHTLQGASQSCGNRRRRPSRPRTSCTMTGGLNQRHVAVRSLPVFKDCHRCRALPVPSHSVEPRTTPAFEVSDSPRFDHSTSISWNAAASWPSRTRRSTHRAAPAPCWGERPTSGRREWSRYEPGHATRLSAGARRRRTRRAMPGTSRTPPGVCPARRAGRRRARRPSHFARAARLSGVKSSAMVTTPRYRSAGSRGLRDLNPRQRGPKPRTLSELS